MCHYGDIDFVTINWATSCSIAAKRYRSQDVEFVFLPSNENVPVPFRLREEHSGGRLKDRRKAATRWGGGRRGDQPVSLSLAASYGQYAYLDFITYKNGVFFDCNRP